MNDTPNSAPFNRLFLIFSCSEKPKNFNELLAQNNCSAFENNYGTKILLKCNDIIPQFCDNLTTKERIYTYEEIIAILTAVEWAKDGSI